MLTWYTHPPKPFDSFYYYDEKARILIRIRLELNRDLKDKNNDTAAFYTETRYVGFSQTRYSREERKLFRVLDGKIIDGKKVPLADKPAKGYIIYDFTAVNDAPKDGFVHRGNKVEDDKLRVLPPNIKQADLEKLVNKCLLLKKDIKLTGPNATGDELAKKIIEEIK